MSGLAAVAERAWAGETPAARALRLALVPAAAAYGAVVAVRNALYDRGWLAARRVPARVVSVGNLAVGGTGKTPAALWLAEALRARGRRVGIVARGYGKRRRGVVVVGVDGAALVSPDEGGDEAVMLARRFAGPVVTGERRLAAAELACARFGLDTIVLDDGFQHRALARDADLVLVGEGGAADRLLPAGRLREPPTALARARAVLAVGAGRLPAPPPVPPGVRAFRAALQATAIVRRGRDAEPLASLAGLTVVAVAGVARPERFLDALRRCGATVRQALCFPDHHRYGGADVAAIAEAAGGAPVVTTEKDLVKLDRLPGLGDLRALRVDLEVEDPEGLLACLAAP